MNSRDISTPADRNRIALVLESVAQKIRNRQAISNVDDARVREALDEIARLECPPREPGPGEHRPFLG